MNIIRDSKKDKHNLFAALGTEGNSVFMALHYDICDLLLNRKRYKDLFSSQERVDLLNETASTFFYNIKRIMLDDIILHIARLTDRKEMGENENLTIHCLPDLVDDDTLKNKITCLYKSALNKSQNIKKVRNKIIAHTDKALALKVTVAPIKYVIQMDEAIDSICEPLNEVSIFYDADSYCLSSATACWDASGGDVGCLIEILKAGQEQMRSQ